VVNLQGSRYTQLLLHIYKVLTTIPYSGKIWRAKNLANCSKSRENLNLAKFKFGEFLLTRVNFT